MKAPLVICPGCKSGLSLSCLGGSWFHCHPCDEPFKDLETTEEYHARDREYQRKRKRKQNKLEIAGEEE